MKNYTDGNILVQAEPITDVEYFREYDGDKSYPDDNPKMGMFVMHGNALTMHWTFYPDPDKFLQDLRKLKMNELKRLRLPQVIEKTGWKKTTIYDKIKKGEFPEPKKDGRTTYWLSTDIDNWIVSRF